MEIATFDLFVWLNCLEKSLLRINANQDAALCYAKNNQESTLGKLRSLLFQAKTKGAARKIIKRGTEIREKIYKK